MNGKIPNPMMRENPGLQPGQQNPQQNLLQQNMPIPLSPQLSPHQPPNNLPPQPQISPSGSNSSLQQSQQGPIPGQHNPGQQQGQRYPNIPPNFQNFRMPPNMNMMMNFMPPRLQAQPQPQQQKKQKKQTQKNQYQPMKMSSQQQYMPPQQQPMPAMQNDQSIMALLQKLSDEKAEIFFRLFEINLRKNVEPRDARYMAIQELNAQLSQVTQNHFQFIHRTLEEFITKDLAEYAKNPPLPVIFQRSKGTKPLFFPVYKTKKEFQFQPRNKERRQNDIIIGTFLTIPMINQPLEGTVMVNKKKVAPSTFGESQESFVIFHGEGMPPSFPIMADVRAVNQNTFFASFFVIQMVTRRSVQETANVLCQLKKVQLNAANSGDAIPCVHKPSCQIDAATLFDSVAATGTAVCPRCCEKLLLSELEWDGAEIPDPQPPETPDLEKMRMFISDQIARQMFSTNPKENEKYDWMEEIIPDSREISFGTTEEYLESIRQFDF